MSMFYSKAQALALAQAQAHQQKASMQQAYHQGLQQQTLAQQAMYNGYPNATSAASTTGMTWVTIPTGTVTTSTVSTTTLGNNTMNQVYSSQHLAAMDNALLRETLRLMGDVTIADGEPCKITLPDGGVLEVDADGSYRINDKDAKVIYRANRVRDFNSYVNASDKLEGFIKFCGNLGIRQEEMLNIPIRLFIGWLILQAAMADGENPEPVELLEGIHDHVRPRCVSCGRFIAPKKAARKIAFCRPVCLERELEAA